MTLKTVDGINCIKLLSGNNNKIAACDLMFRTTFIRVSEWLLATTQQFFSYIMARTS